MRFNTYLSSILLALLLSSAAFGQQQLPAQDTLPKFSLRNIGNNRIIVGWVNNYERVKQISIQRGFDSLGIYKTILSVADPSAVTNGYADTKAPNDRMFYRLFIVFDGGSYFFTEAKKPVWDTAVAVVKTPGVTPVSPTNPVDSIAKKLETPIVKKPEFIPSFYVYTNKDGYVFVNLPDADEKKYRIKFFEEDGSFLFELKNIKEPALTLDKTNFYHAGWFNFELYNDEKLVEKNKVYLHKMH